MGLHSVAEPGASTSQSSGYAVGGVRKLLQAEGLVVLLASVLCFHYVGGHWGLFALLILAPDLIFIAYLGGSSLGAVAYNTVNS